MALPVGPAYLASVNLLYLVYYYYSIKLNKFNFSKVTSNLSSIKKKFFSLLSDLYVYCNLAHTTFYRCGLLLYRLHCVCMSL